MKLFMLDSSEGAAGREEVLASGSFVRSSLHLLNIRIGG